MRAPAPHCSASAAPATVCDDCDPYMQSLCCMYLFAFHCSVSPAARHAPCRYDIYTFSRPDHPLAVLGYPMVRLLQQRFRHDSLRAVARAAACEVVDSSLDEETKRRLELTDGLMDGYSPAAGNKSSRAGLRWPF